MILYSEGATKAQEDEAEMILGALTAAYPNHPWAVRVYDGGFFIRNLLFPKNWGMNCRYRDVAHDAAVMKRQIIMLAGEWLERAGLKRGRGDADQEIEHLEGAPQSAQPHQPMPDDIKIVMADALTPLRETPRPQAVKND